MILLPFGLLLLTGLFEGDTVTKILIALADISLITLAFFSFGEKTKKKLFVESVIYFVLVAPVLKIFITFPFEMFNYFLFIFPSLCFLIGYPLSVIMAYRKVGMQM